MRHDLVPERLSGERAITPQVGRIAEVSSEHGPRPRCIAFPLECRLKR